MAARSSRIPAARLSCSHPALSTHGAALEARSRSSPLVRWIASLFARPLRSEDHAPTRGHSDSAVLLLEELASCRRQGVGLRTRARVSKYGLRGGGAEGAVPRRP